MVESSYDPGLQVNTNSASHKLSRLWTRIKKEEEEEEEEEKVRGSFG